MKQQLVFWIGVLLVVAVVAGCTGEPEPAEDFPTDREVPPETPGAEILDSIPIDTIETGSGAYDSVFQDSGEENEQ